MLYAKSDIGYERRILDSDVQTTTSLELRLYERHWCSVCGYARKVFHMQNER